MFIEPFIQLLKRRLDVFFTINGLQTIIEQNDKFSLIKQSFLMILVDVAFFYGLADGIIETPIAI